MPDNYDNILTNVDDYTASVEVEFKMEACTGGDALKIFEDKCLWFFAIDSNDDNIFDFHDDVFTHPPKQHKPRSCNAFDYEFGDVYQLNWYKVFLCPTVRERTYFLSSRDRYGEFRSHFCMPLTKVDDLVTLFFDNGWIYQMKHCHSK